MRASFCLLLLLTGVLWHSTSGAEFAFPLAGFDDLRTPINPSVSGALAIRLIYSQLVAAVQFAFDDINANPDILPNITLTYEELPHYQLPSLAVANTMEMSAQNRTLVLGGFLSDAAEASGLAAAVYDVAELGNSVQTQALSNKVLYPYYTRMISPVTLQSDTTLDFLSYFGELGGIGWDEFGVISTTEESGVDLSEKFITSAQAAGKKVLSYRQYDYLADGDAIRPELQEIKNTGARVIVAFIQTDFATMFREAIELDMVGPHYVWAVSDFTVNVPFASNANSTVSQAARGTLGNYVSIPSSDAYTAFLTRWFNPSNATLLKFPGLSYAPTQYATISYDMGITAAIALDKLDKQGLVDGRRISAELWSETLRSIEFEGISGPVLFDENGDRPLTLSILVWDSDAFTWKEIGKRSPDGLYEPTAEPVWYDNTTDIPDLDIREPFDYWSCHDQKMKTDETGKTIKRHTPDGSDIDEIDSEYHCDNFIDCKNMSDEHHDCSSDYIGLFIAFGIITGLLILIAIGLIVFVIVFGYVLHYRRLKAASPPFLLMILCSIILGYISVFAWFGKPHPVACGFQPWLLGLSSISMIGALSVRTFRVWRIFRYPMKRIQISNLELFVLWSVIMAPAVLILVIWTIVSTPTATMRHRDNADHYVCETGGFTGPPGGLIFFFIFVAYSALVLFAGMVLAIVARKVPSQFNESKLINFSIYNIAFLAVVIIPVFLTVQPFNPFLAWIFRTLAILYAFTATMALQFVPQIIGIFIVDRCKNVKPMPRAPTTATASFRSNTNSTMSQ